MRYSSLIQWCDEDWGHLTLTIHVNASAQGIGIWFLSEKRGYQSHLPPGAIFLFEVLAICCAVHLAALLGHATCLHIVTNNMNTFNIFRLLSALPAYNCIIISTINILWKNKTDLCVSSIFLEHKMLSWTLCPNKTMNLPPGWCLVFQFICFNLLGMHWGL